MNAYVETKIEKDVRKMTFWIFIQFFIRDGWTMQKYPFGLSNSPLPPTALHSPHPRHSPSHSSSSAGLKTNSSSPLSPAACRNPSSFGISGGEQSSTTFPSRRRPLFSPLALAGHARHRLYLLLQNMRIPNW